MVVLVFAGVDLNVIKKNLIIYDWISVKFSGIFDHGKMSRCLQFFSVGDYHLDPGNFKQLNKYRTRQSHISSKWSIRFE